MIFYLVMWFIIFGVETFYSDSVS